MPNYGSKPWKDTRLAFLLTFKHPRHHAIFILVVLFIEEKNPNEIIKSNQIKKTLLPKHDYCNILLRTFTVFYEEKKWNKAQIL